MGRSFAFARAPAQRPLESSGRLTIKGTWQGSDPAVGAPRDGNLVDRLDRVLHCPVRDRAPGLHPNAGWNEHEPPVPKDIRVHIDTLEYTRNGLNTRDRISLKVGQHNRVVLVRPDRVQPAAGFANVFAPGSAFPGPPVLATFLSAKAAGAMGDVFSHLFGGEPATTFGVFQVYGHADAAGDEAANKALSEKRAEVFQAFLLGDVSAFTSLVEGESWGLGEQQAILRVLQCDPGAIDGEPGELTDAAIHDFQADYVHGFFHRETELEPLNPSLAVDGALGPQTETALLEALVVACSPHMTEDRLHPTHPTAGCAAFNRVSEGQASLNRRVTLVLHETLPEHHDRAPCVVGDAAACPNDGRTLSGCLWFREHVEDIREQDCKHLHWDLRWLPLPNGRVLLSALTTLPDDDEVVFEVFQSKPVAAADEVGDADLGDRLSEPAAGMIRHGVAQLVWDPGPLDVFDPESWFEPLDWERTLGDPQAAWDATNTLRVPLFRISGGRATALSGPPARDIHQMRVDVDGAPPDDGLAWVVDTSGELREVKLRGGRPDLPATLRQGIRTVLRLEVDGLMGKPEAAGE